MEPSTAGSRPRPGPRRRPARFSGPGLAGAVVLFALSLGPALTPRGAVLQGAAAGICAIIGYGIGVLVAAVTRGVGLSRFGSPVRRRHGWWALAVTAPPVVVASLLWSASWQRRLRELMGAPPAAGAGSLTTLGVAIGLALAVLLLARGLRVIARRLAGLIGRRLPPVASRLLAVAAVAVVTVLVLNGAVGQIGRAALERTFAALDKQTFAGNTRPTAPERSGSTASGSSWPSLGREGRRFVSTGPTTKQIAAFDSAVGLARPVLEPIRVYAGRTGADTLDAVAGRVVAELDRTHAWDRSTLVVATTTGTGWVDPAAARAIEMVSGGDSAIAAMQYSYLPGWVGFVGDRQTPVEAGRALYDAVHARWLALASDHRPRLYVYGISLGSYGSQGAFGSLDDVLTGIDGAVWVGTPGFTPLWLQLTAARDPGSPQVAPVLAGGAHVRWGVSLGPAGDDLFALGRDWARPRIVYLQHPSDGVVWWSPSLLLHEPDWMREPRGDDVLSDVQWIPVVSFVQLTTDLLVAGQAPTGHGHSYAVEYADAWSAVIAPPEWTTADTVALRAVLAGRS